MDYFIIIIGVLLLLAALDLIVGVSNDAVNFLNSAIGSKVASYRTIIIIAITGIIIGSVFSSGIMEIARKGIFYPQHFTFEVILIVFLAVMLTDLILLDVFNSLGLPTSTTVSIVFELLGASLMAGFLFSMSKNDTINDIWKYINFESTGNIVSGIFLSIFIAFTAGVLIQYISRLLFTFQIEDKIKKFGSVFSGVGITAIIYFLLIKGLKGTTLLNKETSNYIQDHTWLILLVLFAFSTIVLFFLQKKGINPLKIVVLAGTFSLAMAFAGNDLVNFIGVPITGLLAYQDWLKSGVPANEYYMDYLAGNDVIVPNYMLLLAGIIMGLTIWISAKAKKVTETEVSLGRQDEGEERFKPNAISRSIVNSSLTFGKIFDIIIPANIVKRYNASLEKNKLKEATLVQDEPAFDLVRASINLVVAAIIIAWATSNKLPLSTTYVSFMVAMGSSLADKAWGRESAVYRVAGVLSVIGGWFITAFIAFSIAALFALILFKTGNVGTYLMIGGVLFYLIVSHIRFSKKEKKEKKSKNRLIILDNTDLNTVEKYKSLISTTISEVAESYHYILEGLIKNDVSKLEKAYRLLKEMQEHSLDIRSKSIRYLKSLQTNDNQTAEVIILSSDFIQDLSQSTKALSDEAYFYIKNLHEVSDKQFLNDLQLLDEKMSHFFSMILISLEQTESEKFENIREERNLVRNFINDKLQFQINNIYTQKPSTKEGVLQTNVFLQSRDIQAVLTRISKMFLKLYEKRVQNIH